jgi:hypothetical protein
LVNRGISFLGMFVGAFLGLLVGPFVRYVRRGTHRLHFVVRRHIQRFAGKRRFRIGRDRLSDTVGIDAVGIEEVGVDDVGMDAGESSDEFVMRSSGAGASDVP